MPYLKIALAVVQLALALLALFADDVRRPIKHYLVLGLCLTFILTVYDIYGEYEGERAKQVTGVLKPRSAFEKFEAFRFTHDPEAPISLRMGASETVLTMDLKTWKGDGGDLTENGPEFRRRFFSGPTPDHGIYLWFEGGQIMLGIKLYNRQGELVAEIDGNRWFVKRERLYDLNFDDEAFEVRNAEGQVQLQVVFYQNMVQLEYFNYYLNTGTVFGASPDGKGGFMGVVAEDGRSPLNTKPLFKYPSILYRGVRVEKK